MNSFIVRASTIIEADAKTTIKNRIKSLQDAIAKYKSHNTTGSHDKRLAGLREQLKKKREELKALKD